MKNNLQDKKNLSKRLIEKAINEGFTISGIASIPGSSRLKLRTNALDRWLSNNYHGEMNWMETERRKNISFLLEGAKSDLSVGFTYINSENNQNCRMPQRHKIGFEDILDQVWAEVGPHHPLTSLNVERVKALVIIQFIIQFPII